MAAKEHNWSWWKKIPGILLIGFLVIVIFFPGWIAGERPLIAKVENGNIRFNFFKVNHTDTNRLYADEIPLIDPLIPFHPVRANLAEGRLLPPFSIGKSGNMHWLGTDHLGRDVLSGLVWGAGTSLSVGVIAVLISLFVAVFLGGISGYYGDKKWYVSRTQIAFLLCAFILCFFAAQWRAIGMKSSALFLIIIVLILTTVSFRLQKREISVPVDSILSGLINVFDALPALIIAIVFFLTFGNIGIINLSVLIGLLKVPSFYRITRAEVVRVKERPYVQRAELSGRNFFWIIWREIFPNISGPLTSHAVYSLASVIIIESTISFLNIGGINSGYISWGKQLSLGRNYIGEWWLVVFPGICIFLTIIGLRYMASKTGKSNSVREY